MKRLILMNEAVDKILQYTEVPRMPHCIEVAFETHDSVIVPVSVWVEMNLKVGMEVHTALLHVLQTEASVAKAKDQALSYLQWKPRTAYEVLHYLEKKQYETTLCQRVVSDLETSQVIDDAVYAKLYVQQKYRQLSRRALSWKLERNGLAKGVIHAALESDYPRELEEETARVIADKFERKGRHWPLQKRKQKLGAHLQRHGFPSAIVRKLAFELTIDNVNDSFLDND